MHSLERINRWSGTFCDVFVQCNMVKLNPFTSFINIYEFLATLHKILTGTSSLPFEHHPSRTVPNLLPPSIACPVFSSRQTRSAKHQLFATSRWNQARTPSKRTCRSNLTETMSRRSFIPNNLSASTLRLLISLNASRRVYRRLYQRGISRGSHPRPGWFSRSQQPVASSHVLLGSSFRIDRHSRHPSLSPSLSVFLSASLSWPAVSSLAAPLLSFSQARVLSSSAAASRLFPSFQER